jgi:hypothetical protein
MSDFVPFSIAKYGSSFTARVNVHFYDYRFTAQIREKVLLICVVRDPLILNDFFSLPP